MKSKIDELSGVRRAASSEAVPRKLLAMTNGAALQLIVTTALAGTLASALAVGLASWLAR